MESGGGEGADSWPMTKFYYDFMLLRSAVEKKDPKPILAVRIRIRKYSSASNRYSGRTRGETGSQHCSVQRFVKASSAQESTVYVYYV